MTEHQTIQRYLEEWAGDDEERQAVADITRIIAESCSAISEIIALGPLAGTLGAEHGRKAYDVVQTELDIRANDLIIKELRSAPVAWVVSEELGDPIELNKGAPMYVAIDPLDGSSNIDTNVSVGTIYSVLPMKCDKDDTDAECFLQKGDQQVAAGYVIYGPQTALVMTLGEGTHIFTLNPDTGEFCLTMPGVSISEDTHEFAINSSNSRRWDGYVRAYIDDCLKGEEGPHNKNYNTRWIASLVAECHRIMSRGGIFLYPGDRRPGYHSGRLRLAYQCNPIAFLTEQAGGAASDGHQRILEIEPSHIHQRVPMIFGSINEVALVDQYYRDMDPIEQRSQLFGTRGLFKV